MHVYSVLWDLRNMGSIRLLPGHALMIHAGKA